MSEVGKYLFSFPKILHSFFNKIVETLLILTGVNFWASSFKRKLLKWASETNETLQVYADILEAVAFQTIPREIRNLPRKITQA